MNLEEQLCLVIGFAIAYLVLAGKAWQPTAFFLVGFKKECDLLGEGFIDDRTGTHSIVDREAPKPLKLR